jgi:pimeloyl-ACP methyl ester carboxylesterase
MMLRLAQGAVLLLLTGLVSCTAPSPPKVKTPDLKQATVPVRELKDARLSHDLAELQSGAAKDEAKLTEKIILGLQSRLSLRQWKNSVRILDRRGQAWVVHFDTRSMAEQGMPEWSPSFFDTLYPAAGFDVKDYQHVNAGPGIGFPVVLMNDDIETLRKERVFRPGNPMYVPGTVVMDFSADTSDPKVRHVTCRMVNTLEHRTVVKRGRKQGLAFNITAMVDASLRDRYIIKNGLRGLLRPDKRDKDIGLFGITRYRKGQIPVVFVHGLDSSPATWRNAVNEVLHDPQLASKYMPVLFLYPSGLPVPTSAAKLRESIQAFRQRWDPEGTDPGMNKMILVGHSMGGILSRLQVLDSGEELWRSFFYCKVDELPVLTKSQRKAIYNALHFKKTPGIERVVFVAVPHRGSTVADLKVVKWLVRLIKIPSRLMDTATRLMTLDTTVINPALFRFNNLGLRSVDMLSPNHPYFEAIDKLPITTPFHSIIGDRGKGDGKDSSDGLVPYWSSHLDGAESELIVPHGHCCTNTPEAVNEIVRILSLP